MWAEQAEEEPNESVVKAEHSGDEDSDAEEKGL